MKWIPIEQAPKDETPVALLRAGEDLEHEDRILLNYVRTSMGRDNVFYEPIYSGLSCVRDATHFIPMAKLSEKP